MEASRCFVGSCACSFVYKVKPETRPKRPDRAGEGSSCAREHKDASPSKQSFIGL